MGSVRTEQRLITNRAGRGPANFKEKRASLIFTAKKRNFSKLMSDAAKKGNYPCNRVPKRDGIQRMELDGLFCVFDFQVIEGWIYLVLYLYLLVLFLKINTNLLIKAMNFKSNIS